MNKETFNEEIEDKHAVVGYEVEVTTKRVAKTITTKLPKLPMELFQQIMSFMVWGSKEKNCEVIVSLTLVEGEWVIIPWHQAPSGALHVKFNQHDEDNTRDFGHLFEALEEVHCTIHSHNKAGAHQSADDKDDELSKRGWHMTIGKCDKDKKDFHARYNLKNNAKFDEEGVKIQEAVQDFVLLYSENLLDMDVPEHLLKYKKMLIEEEMNIPSEHPKEWEDNVTKVAYTPYYGGKKTKNYPSQKTLGLPKDEVLTETVTHLRKWRAKDVA